MILLHLATGTPGGGSISKLWNVATLTEIDGAAVATVAAADSSIDDMAQATAADRPLMTRGDVPSLPLLEFHEDQHLSAAVTGDCEIITMILDTDVTGSRALVSRDGTGGDGFVISIERD